MDARLTARLAAKRDHLNAFRPLSRSITTRLAESLRLLLTYHSNAIEGNTLSLRETQIVIEEGITIGGHPLREHLEATNHAQAYEYLTTLATEPGPITRDTILDLHRLIMTGIDDSAGRFRTGAVYIRGARMTPPTASQVERLIAKWLEWVGGPGMDYPTIVRAAVAHHDFEAIHPFFDGNGRTGRLLLNLMLMRDGWPPALLLRSWRVRYLSALDSAGDGRFNPLLNLIGRSVEGGLDIYLDACAAAVYEPEPGEEYKPLAELSGPNGYTASYLGWLVRQGRVEAVKRAGRLYSTERAVAQYRREVEQRTIERGRPRKGDRRQS
ncbi:MAG TPA: Fic family protein [Chloroflexia bacterium]|nr:Fic family protein [Chloroflexia bacterium]